MITELDAPPEGETADRATVDLGRSAGRLRPRRRHRWLGLIAVLTAIVLNLLDSTIVNVAAPTIRADIGGSQATVQWVAAAYTLALAAGLLTGGRLGDMFGRRRMVLLGVAGFVVASAGCAGAWSPESLITARGAQGLCGALLIPQAFGLIRDLFPPEEISKAFAALGPVIGLSTILGPVAAGLLIDANVLGLGWRSVFLINVPVGLCALALGAVALPASARSRHVRLDALGAGIAGSAMVLLVYPLVQGRSDGWSLRHLLMVAVAGVLFCLFVLQQRRRAQRGRWLLVEPTVLRRRSYAAGVAFVVVFFGAVVGFSLTISLALQMGLGYDPTSASLIMASWAVGSFVGSGVGATVMNRFGRKIVHLGLLCMAGALAVMATIFAGVVGPIVSWPLLAALATYGVGMGMIFVPLFDIILGEVADHEVGSASSLLESLQQLGASLGVAALGTLYFHVAGEAPSRASTLGSSQVVAMTTLALTCAAYALAFLLPRRPRRPDLPSGGDLPAVPMSV